MKRVFKFKEGQAWDGDEAIIDFLEDYLLEEGSHLGACPIMRRDCKVTIIVENLPSSTKGGK